MFLFFDQPYFIHIVPQVTIPNPEDHEPQGIRREDLKEAQTLEGELTHQEEPKDIPPFWKITGFHLIRDTISWEVVASLLAPANEQEAALEQLLDSFIEKEYNKVNSQCFARLALLFPAESPLPA